MDSGMYKPVQLAAAKALENNKSWYESINKEYSKRRELVFKIFDALDSSYDKQQAGLFIWAKIPSDFSDAYALSDSYLRDAKIFITPGGIFGSGGNSYARISLCSSTDLLKKSLERIQQVLKQRNKN